MSGTGPLAPKHQRAASQAQSSRKRVRQSVLDRRPRLASTSWHGFDVPALSLGAFGVRGSPLTAAFYSIARSVAERPLTAPCIRRNVAVGTFSPHVGIFSYSGNELPPTSH